MNNEDGGKRAKSSPQCHCPVCLRHWELQCVPMACFTRKSPFLSQPHGSPVRPDPKLQLTGPRVSVQAKQGQRILSLRIWAWHQEREVVLSLPVMWTEEDKSTERKTRLKQTQWERPGWELESPEASEGWICSQDPAVFQPLVSVRHHPVYPLFA